MSQRIFWRSLLLIFVVVVGLTPVTAQSTETLTVFAASSLIDAFEAIASDFEATNLGVDILFNFASSSDLAAQLSEGAPADVFASANHRQMQVANEAGRIGESPRTFVKNRLVLIVPSDNPANIHSLRDLANEGVLLVLAAQSVPVRDYTNTMLDRLADDPVYGEHYRNAFMANVVSEEENVRGVAAKVALGEADAGIVYISDVTPDIARQVIALPIPDALNTIATYPIAITDDAANPELAQAFVDYVLSDEGQATLGEWNFIPAKIPELPNTVMLPEAGTITLDGQVLNPMSLTIESLQRDFTTHEVKITSIVEGDIQATTYAGVRLWELISAAQPNFNADVGGDAGSLYFVVTAADGYQVVLAWTQVSPDYTNDHVLLAYARDGEALTEPYAPAILVVPSYSDPSRYIYAVANLSLRDAPGVSE